MNELSKYLCLLLRHQPDKAGLDMDEHGWVSVEQLIVGVNRHSSYKLDRELLEQIVAEDNKGRYRFDEKHEKSSAVRDTRFRGLNLSLNIANRLSFCIMEQLQKHLKLLKTAEL